MAKEAGGYRKAEKRKLILSLSITAGAMVIEFIGGFLTNSIALVSDAGHMFTHCFAIGISLGAIIIASRPPCHHKTYGMYRAEILAAFINGLFLMLVVGVIAYESITRMLHPKEILAFHMLVIALIGLLVNSASIIILMGSHKRDINIKSVFFHLIADAVSSVAIIIGAIVIYYTGWVAIDPVISIAISAIIAYWAIGLLMDSSRVLLEMAPRGLNIDMIGGEIKSKFPEIREVYNMHLWTITTDMMVFSAHAKLVEGLDSNNIEELMPRIDDYLYEKHGIIESTIQVDSRDERQVCKIGERSRESKIHSH